MPVKPFETFQVPCLLISTSKVVRSGPVVRLAAEPVEPSGATIDRLSAERRSGA